MAKQKHTGITIRHSRSCPETNKAGACRCKPTYWTRVYDRRAVRHEKNCPAHDGAPCRCTPTKGVVIHKTFDTLKGAKAWRADAQVALRNGTMRAPDRKTLREARYPSCGYAALSPV